MHIYKIYIYIYILYTNVCNYFFFHAAHIRVRKRAVKYFWLWAPFFSGGDGIWGRRRRKGRWRKRRRRRKRGRRKRNDGFSFPSPGAFPSPLTVPWCCWT